MMNRFLLLFALITIAFAACKKDNDKEEEDYIILDLDEYVQEHFPGAQPTESGVYVIIVSEGAGPKPTEGEKLYTYYKGTLLTGERFDSVLRSTDPEKPRLPYIFTLNSKSTALIKGWYRGFAELNKGSKAVLLIPDSLAYGDVKRGIIPPKSPLRFDVELIYPDKDKINYE